jgi:catechol 2,3-dioxygenase-like lactoylglutathione lyase family enzyme
MLSDLEVYAMIPAADLERARRFYEEKLSFVPSQEMPGILFYDSGGSGFGLYATTYAGTGKHTLMAWETPNLDREMTNLRSRGVVFEEYDLPELKTVKGVATMEGSKTAWFKDSEGNVLAITQRT